MGEIALQKKYIYLFIYPHMLIKYFSKKKKNLGSQPNRMKKRKKSKQCKMWKEKDCNIIWRENEK